MMQIGTEGQCLIWLCDKAASAETRNYCAEHLAMMEATGDLLPVGYEPDQRPACERCGKRPVKAHDLCESCYKKDRRVNRSDREAALEKDRRYRQRKRARERNQSQLATVA